ncbi:MAG TPA: hypothetical protein VL175_19260 [Pirellulales bacterium]|jgi:hypothetical protein|nr:hypothetical protein [Pirellulales bacterium]
MPSIRHHRVSKNEIHVDARRANSRFVHAAAIAWLAALISWVPMHSTSASQDPAAASPAKVTASETNEELLLTWQGDELIQVAVSKRRGIFQAPLRIKVNHRTISLGGIYVHINDQTEGFTVQSTVARLRDEHIEVNHVLRHPKLAEPTTVRVELWMTPDDRGLRTRIAVEGKDQHLDRLGWGDHAGEQLEAERMYFGRMYVLDKPQAFEHQHNYNTCRFWCWKMANGLSELQATGGPARGFRFDPAKGRYDLHTYCESPIDYLLFFTEKGPNEAIAEYRRTIEIPAPATLAQLPGRVGVMTAYPISERYQDFLEEWVGRGARDFVWLSYYPTPGDRQKVSPHGALYATYDLYLDYFAEGPRKATGWAPDKVQYRGTGKRVRGYWSSNWLLPELYVAEATTRVMGVFGREFNDDEGKPGFIPTAATRYSNLAITKAEVGPSALYLDVHASKVPHHYFDSQGRHHGAWQHMRGEKALFDFARQYLGNVPIWSEGGGEDYVGLMDGGWFMDYRPPAELGIQAEKWQYFPFIDLVHRQRLLNMSIYYPPDHYDVNMVNLAILFGRPQAVSAYYGTRQEDIGGRLRVYYMTKAFHQMLGLSRMERIEFQDDDINCCKVSYSNGARVWVNRGDDEWTVEGFRLGPLGFLIRGPKEFLEYRAIKDENVAEMVHCDEYDYVWCEKSTDFGPIVTDGAVAVSRQNPDRIVVHEVVKPRGSISLKLGELPGTEQGQQAMQAWAVQTRDRRLELTFPDLRQPTDPKDRGKPGNRVDLRPTEMRETLRYEIQLSARSGK